MNNFWKSWGLYLNPWETNNSWNTAADINRVLAAQQTFMDEIYSYNTKQVKTTIKKTFYNKRDPSRPRINKYL